MKGLILNVYVDSDGSDCTNGGISSKFKNVTLIPADGPFEPAEDRPAVTLIRRNIGGSDYIHLVPCDENAKPLPGWWMFGGNFAYTSDSRNPSKYPIPIHDRQE
jgi:hypothetical protein